jgi:hypothetical protein
MPELDEFLGDEPAPEPVAAIDAPVVEAPAEAPAPEGEEAKPAEPGKPEPAEEAKPEPEDVTGLKAALQAERAKRNDHKGRADRLEGEMAALKAQIEEAKKAPVPPAPAAPAAAPPPMAIPNPVEDPQGYHQYQELRRFSDKLDISEAMLRQQIGNDADVDAKAARFKQMAEANPALRADLQRSGHPYKFAYDTAAKAMAMDEIGDPMSFRSKLEAEIRAKIEAEMAGTAAPTATRVQLPQSLGTVRSASPRNVAVINVPESLDDILAVARK